LLSELLVLLATFCLQNYWHISVLMKKKNRNYSKFYKIFRAYFLNYRNALIWQVLLVSQASRSQFSEFKKILRNLQLSKVNSLDVVRMAQRNVRTPINVREDSGRGDWSLMKKRVKRVIEIGCCLLSGHLLSRSGCRLENSKSCNMSYKAYKYRSLGLYYIQNSVLNFIVLN
jgi:hypothetical protein